MFHCIGMIISQHHMTYYDGEYFWAFLMVNSFAFKPFFIGVEFFLYTKYANLEMKKELQNAEKGSERLE